TRERLAHQGKYWISRNSRSLLLICPLGRRGGTARPAADPPPEPSPPVLDAPGSLREVGLPVHRHHPPPAPAQRVLHGCLCAGPLTLLGLAPHLPIELRALRGAGRAEWVTLRDQAARRIHHPLAAIGIGGGIDELPRLALGAEAKRFVGDELIGREAIVQ